VLLLLLLLLLLQAYAGSFCTRAPNMALQCEAAGQTVRACDLTALSLLRLLPPLLLLLLLL
jgi:hypothetical protein